MAMKYCEACSNETEMSVFECSKCGGSSFVHKREDVTGVATSAPSSETSSPVNSLTAARSAPVGAGAASQTFQVDRINELIREQSRTTHAVRAIAVFLLSQFISLTAAGFVIGLGTSDPYADTGNYFIAAGLIIIAGTIASIVATFAELKQSE